MRALHTPHDEAEVSEYIEVELNRHGIYAGDVAFAKARRVMCWYDRSFWPDIIERLKIVNPHWFAKQ